VLIGVCKVRGKKRLDILGFRIIDPDNERSHQRILWRVVYGCDDPATDCASRDDSSVT
jgi:hypothetical protein